MKSTKHKDLIANDIETGIWEKYIIGLGFSLPTFAYTTANNRGWIALLYWFNVSSKFCFYVSFYYFILAKTFRFVRSFNF